MSTAEPPAAAAPSSSKPAQAAGIYYSSSSSASADPASSSKSAGFRRTSATACIVFVLLLFFLFSSTMLPSMRIGSTSSTRPLDTFFDTGPSPAAAAGPAADLTKPNSPVVENTLPPAFTNLPDADAPNVSSNSSSTSSSSRGGGGGALFDSSILNPAFRCSKLLEHGINAIQRSAMNFTAGRPRSENKANCPPAQTLETCASNWLAKCWWEDARRHGGELCANVTLFTNFARMLRQPRKSFYWRENAPQFLHNLQKFLGSSADIILTPCAVVREISKRACAVLSRRDLSFEFIRGSGNNASFETQQQTTTTTTMATSPLPLEQIRLTGHFSTDVSVRVLESYEFQDSMRKPAAAKIPLTDSSLRVDLFTVGMFFRSLEYAKSSWRLAEDAYWSSFNFRHRHFFCWNSVRAPSVRLGSARSVYGEELRVRNDFIRKEVLGGNYQTWLTLDVEFPGLKDLANPFHHVVVLRALGFMYLTSLDEEAARTVPFAARVLDRTLASIAGQRSAESKRLADYIVLVRPDNFYNLRGLATIIRGGKANDGSLSIASGGRRPRNFVLTNESGKKYVLCGGGGTGGGRGKGSGKIDRVTDQFLVSGTVTLAHVYISILNVLHSCVRWPMPRYAFIEFFMLQGVREAGAHAGYVMFGSGLDRFGGENGTSAPAPVVMTTHNASGPSKP